MCGVIDDQFSEVERRQTQLLAKENGSRMAQDLAQPAKKEVLGISGPHLFGMKPLCQLTKHRINQVTFWLNHLGQGFFSRFADL
jgi:hypothetical protein